jgi:hypothetical protein
MKLTGRERWMCAGLPAAVILLIYGVFFARPRIRSAAAIRTALLQEDPAAVRAERLQRAETERARLAAELAALPAEDGDAGPEAAQSVAARRVATLERLSTLCAEAGVTLLHAANAAASSSTDRHSAARHLLEQAGWRDPEIWHVELRGGYLSITRLVEALARPPAYALPVRVDFHAGPGETGPFHWVLEMWM